LAGEAQSEEIPLRRFIPFIVMLLYACAITAPVVGGPWYGYVAAPVLAFLVAAFALVYPSDRSSRVLFGSFGGLFLFLGLFGLVLDGLSWDAASRSSGFVLIGLANVICAVWPIDGVRRSSGPT
jgi:hypothetical protein